VRAQGRTVLRTDWAAKTAAKRVAEPGKPFALCRVMTPVIDFSVIEVLRGFREEGEADPIVELRSLFIEDAGKHLQILNAAVESGDARSVRRAAHSLMGMSGTIGAMRLWSMSEALEKAEPSAIDRARLLALETEFQRVSDALRAA
jgi:HPt (histidine-containing phosphotransfer) domain-containing protein